MLEQKKVTLEIAGIPMPSFVQLMLKQSINEHHYFEITLDIQAIEAYGVEIPEKREKSLFVEDNFHDVLPYIMVK